MKSLFWFLVPFLALSGCSQTEPEKEAVEPVVLSIDGTAEEFTGESSTVSGGDLFRAISELADLNGRMDLRIRDGVGWMTFRFFGESDKNDVIAEFMSLEILRQSIAMNDLELSDEELLSNLQPYLDTKKILGDRPTIFVSAADLSRIDDCLKYLRILHDTGVTWFIVPPNR